MTKAKLRPNTPLFGDSLQETQFVHAAEKENLLAGLVQFQDMRLRLPTDLYQQVATQATKENRSINSEVIRRLRMSYAETRSCPK